MPPCAVRYGISTCWPIFTFEMCRASEWPLKAQLAAQQLVQSRWDSVASLVNSAAATLPTSSLAVHAITLPLPNGSNCSAAQAVAHSLRGDGLEALALLVPVDSAGHPWLAALAASIALSAGQHLTAQPWLARDVVLAFVDCRCGRLQMTQVCWRLTESQAASTAERWAYACGSESDCCTSLAECHKRSLGPSNVAFRHELACLSSCRLL